MYSRLSDRYSLTKGSGVRKLLEKSVSNDFHTQNLQILKYLIHMKTDFENLEAFQSLTWSSVRDPNSLKISSL